MNRPPLYKISGTPSEPPHGWEVFTAAPHRMLFFAGAIQTGLVMLLWLAELLGRTGVVPLLPLVVASTWVHGFLMVYGVFPFFIFGFLFTVYPRWMGAPVVPMSRYVAAFAFLVAGMILFYVGLFVSRWVVALALTLQLAGWAVALHALFAVFRHASKRGTHERLLNLALAAGMFGVACFLVGVLFQVPFAFALAREVGLWLFMLPVVFLVAHRMVPFFSQSVLIDYIMVRPAWGPPLMLVCVAGHTLLELMGLSAWRFIADAPLAMAALHHSWTWQFRRSFHARLLAMLHIAFLWLAIAMTLYTAQSLALLITGVDYLGRAPLHALGIGFFTGMVVAMASRVTLGHSGRAVEADDLTWFVLLGVNLSAIARIAAEFVPGTIGGILNVTAAATWLVSFLLWIGLYAPMYLRPRVDRQAG